MQCLSPVMNLNAIQHSLKEGAWLSSDLRCDKRVRGWGRVWVWIKKVFGFCPHYRLSSVVFSILKHIQRSESQREESLKEALYVLRSLSRKAIRARRQDLLMAIEQEQAKIQEKIEILECLYNPNLGQFYPELPENIRSNINIALTALMQNSDLVTFFPACLLKNKELALVAVKQNGLNLMYFDETLKDDFDVAMAAVEQNGLALALVSRRLRSNMYLVTKAVSKSVFYLNYAGEEVKNRLLHSDHEVEYQDRLRRLSFLENPP